MSEAATTGSLVWRLSMKWRAAVDRAVASIGLTHAQYVLLATLYGMSLAGARPSQRELAVATETYRTNPFVIRLRSRAQAHNPSGSRASKVIRRAFSTCALVRTTHRPAASYNTTRCLDRRRHPSLPVGMSTP
jgi:hypothetical protein